MSVPLCMMPHGKLHGKLHGKKCLEHLELQASNCRHGDNGKVYGLIGAPVLLPHIFQYQTAQCSKNEEHKNAHGRAAGFAVLFQLPFQSLLSLLSQVAAMLPTETTLTKSIGHMGSLAL